MSNSFSTIADYISLFDGEKKELLIALREIIASAAPEATETINYQMPTFRYNGNLIHFAMSKNHLGLYPGPAAIVHFADQLTAYKTSKGAIQLPLDKPLPKKLIQDIVHYNIDRLHDKEAPDWKKYNSQWAEATEKVAQIIHELPLTKEFKWGGDIYTYQGKNVVAFSGFKNHFAIWFHNGVFLSDPQQVLVSASEGKTKSLRQWRFTSADDIDPKLVKSYIEEAIQTVIDGKELKAEKSTPLTLDGILKETLANDPTLDAAFTKLTPGKQREYIEHIADAKQEKTKITRIEKITPLILQGKGLHDKYKK